MTEFLRVSCHSLATLTRVDEGVSEGWADVVGRQRALGIHNTARKFPHFTRPQVLTHPPELVGAAQDKHFGTGDIDHELCSTGTVFNWRQVNWNCSTGAKVNWNCVQLAPRSTGTVLNWRQRQLEFRLVSPYGLEYVTITYFFRKFQLEQCWTGAKVNWNLGVVSALH